MGTLRTSICHVVVLSALSMTASTWTVSFDPAGPVSTNGWNLGTTTPQTTRSSTQPGGRKFDPTKGETEMIESPLLTADIRSVAWSAWGNNLNATSKVEVLGRADATSPYMTLFSRTELSNRLVVNPRGPSAASCGSPTRKMPEHGFSRRSRSRTTPFARSRPSTSARRRWTPTNGASA